jgi:hypothetical protein
VGLVRVGIGILFVVLLTGIAVPIAGGSGPSPHGSTGVRDLPRSAGLPTGFSPLGHPAVLPSLTPPPCSPWNNTTFNLSLVASHAHIDLSTPLSLFAVCKIPGGVFNTTKLTWRWSTLPPGCQTGPNQTLPGSFVKCTPKSTWSGRIKLTGFANSTNTTGPPGPHFKASDNVTVTINATVSVLLGANPKSGPAPLTTNVSTAINGGTPPFTISWITGDGSIGLGRFLSHTYSGPGTYHVEVWVNDSTVSYASNQSWFGTFNITVGPGAPGMGLFGLRGAAGWVIIGALVGGVALLILYGILIRRRAPRLPPPERWMVPDAGRPGRPPAEPNVPRRPPPST